MSAIKSDRPSRGPRLRLGIISNELHRRGEGDFLLLVQQAQSLLEVFLAAVEGFVDVIRITLVGNSHLTVMGLEVVQDAVSKVIDTHFLNLGQGDIDLAVRAHLLDKSLESVTDIYLLIGLVLVNLAPMGIVDDDAVAQVTALHHQHLDALAMIVVGLSMIEELGEFGAGNDAVAGSIQIDTNNVAATGLHVHALLTEGHQQIFGHQTPVQKCAHLVHGLDTHESEIADNGLGLLGSGDRTVLAVIIYKNADHIAHLHFGCEVTLGQQDLVGIIIDEIGAEINHSVDAQLVEFSNLHNKTGIFFAKFVKKFHIPMSF